jgi:hypothetical protein
MAAEMARWASSVRFAVIRAVIDQPGTHDRARDMTEHGEADSCDDSDSTQGLLSARSIGGTDGVVRARSSI